MRCPGCDLPVMTEADASHMNLFDSDTKNEVPCESVPLISIEKQNNEVSLKSSSLKSSSLKVAVAFSLSDPSPDPDPSDPSDSYEEMKRQYDLERKSSGQDQVSSKLGEKLLLGWVMLGELCMQSKCRGTPLMSSNGVITCVSCEGMYSRTLTDGEIYLLPKNIIKKNLDNRQQEEFMGDDLPILHYAYSGDEYSTGTGNAYSSNSVDAVSKKLSQKLLQGWALLDEVCPKSEHLTPLVRDRNGVKHCVLCMEVSTSADKVTVGKTSELQAKGGVSNSTAVRGFDVDFEEEDSGDDDDDDETADDMVAYEKYVTDRIAIDRKTDKATAQNPIQGKKCKGATTNSKKILAAHANIELEVRDILYKKLLETANLLKATDGKDTATCTFHLTLLRELMTVIREV